MSYQAEFRVRIRNRADSADLLVVTSVSGDVAPNYAYLKEPPRGDGASFNPLTGESLAASYTALIVDAIKSGTDRVVTSQIEDVNGQLQLGYLKAYVQWRRDAGAYHVSGPGTITVTSGSGAVSGSGTTFRSMFAVGDKIRANSEIRTISAIASDTAMTTDNWGANASAVAYQGDWPALCMGYLVLLRLVDASTWEITIQDATRVQGGVELFNALSATTITSFLSTWPNRGCFFGGPVIGSFLGLPDLGGWTLRVHELTSAGGYPITVGRKAYWLEFVNYYQSVYGPTQWSIGAKSPNIVSAIAEELNKKVRELPHGTFLRDTSAASTVGDAYSLDFFWRGLVLLINGVPFRPIPPAFVGIQYGGAAGTPDSAPLNDLIAPPGTPKPGVFAWLDSQTPLTDGATVTVRCLTVLPSEVSPIFIDKHPVDVLTDIWTLAGIAYDATAATALKNSDVLGASLRVSRRITGTEQMGQFLRDTVLVPFQIGIRSDEQGRLVPFSTKIVLNSIPTKTITDALVVDESVRLPFELDVTQALQRVTFRHKQQNMLVGISPDGVIESDVELTLLNGDASAMPSGTVEINVPGMVRTAPNSTAANLDWLRGLAQQLFDRFGRGGQQVELDLLRGDGTTDADTVNLGDEILLNIKQLPNKNKRIGDDGTVGSRAMQISRLTELPARRSVRLISSGPNAAALATLPTLAIALSSDLPRSIAAVTVTNAAALNALGYAVRLQRAETSGGAPASTDYTDVYTSPMGSIPTTGISLPPGKAGYAQYVRARSELTYYRPSSWTAAVNVGLTAVNDPASFAAASVAADGSSEDLTWVAGANATKCFTDVWIRAFGAAFATAIKLITLPPGSTQYRLHGLTPNTHYTASVQHRDPATQDTSNVVDVSFTCANVTVTLAVPKYPDGFSVPAQNAMHQSRFPTIPVSLYGLAVVAQEFPSDIEFAEAVETGAATGLYGAYATVSRVPSIVGDWTKWTGFAPNDGKRRLLKARAVKDGATSSSYCAEIVVTPWTADALADYAAATLLALKNFREISRTTTDITFGWDIAGTPNQLFVWLNTYSQPIASDPWPALNTAPTYRLTAATVSYTVPIPDIGKTTYFQIAAVDVNGSTSKPWQVPIQGTFADVPQGVVSIDATGVPTAVIDGPDWVGSYRYATSTSAQPSDATALAGTIVSGRQLLVTGAALALAASFYVTAIPFAGSNADGYQGVSIRLRATRHDFSATKTIYFGPNSLTPLSANYGTTLDYVDFTNGYISFRNITAGGSPAVLSFLENFQVPNGATITLVTGDFYTDASYMKVEMTLYRTDSTGARTSIGNCNSTTHGGWETKNFTCSESTANRRYQVLITMQSIIAPPLAGADARCAGFYITYSMPTSDITL